MSTIRNTIKRSPRIPVHRPKKIGNGAVSIEPRLMRGLVSHQGPKDGVGIGGRPGLPDLYGRLRTPFWARCQTGATCGEKKVVVKLGVRVTVKHDLMEIVRVHVEFVDGWWSCVAEAERTMSCRKECERCTRPCQRQSFCPSRKSACVDYASDGTVSVPQQNNFDSAGE